MIEEREFFSMSASDIARNVRSKQLSAMEVVEAAIRQLEALNPLLHAFCTPTLDLAREQAAAIERTVMEGGEPGALSGVPIGVKDLICTAGIRTVSGSAAYEDFIPAEDDIVVERVKAAGAILLGKTNTSEFGYCGIGHNPVFETTKNPWDLSRTSGGSSAGSGAAVAAGICPLALGSDGGGSIRIPSGFCGTYGIKASMGRVPLYPGCRDERYPGVSGWESIEHIGPLSRTVEDAALMLSVISGPDDRDRLSLPEASFDWLESLKGDIKGLRVAFSPDFGYLAVDPEVRRAATEAAEVFERELGCDVEVAHPGFVDSSDAFWALVWMESDLKGLRAMADKYEDRMTPLVLDAIRHDWKAEDFTNAVMQRKAVVNKMWRFMRKYDLLITPTLSVPAFAADVQGPEKIENRIVKPSQWMGFLYPFNLTGQPAANVPIGFTQNGLPVGLQIVGRRLDDPLVLRASAAFESVRPWRNHFPPQLTG